MSLKTWYFLNCFTKRENSFKFSVMNQTKSVVICTIFNVHGLDVLDNVDVVVVNIAARIIKVIAKNKEWVDDSWMVLQLLSPRSCDLQFTV